MTSRIFTRIIILILLGWVGVGLFPFVNIESDAALLSASMDYFSDSQLFSKPSINYGWDMQPGIYYLTYIVKQIINTNSVLIYYSITIIFWCLFLFFVSLFLTQLLSVRIEYIFISLFLFPSITNIVYYPNTAIIAGVFIFSAFSLILYKKIGIPIKIIIVSLLLCMAAVFRLDSVILYPVILLLFIHLYTFRTSLIYSLLVFILFVFITLSSYYILDANPLITLNNYADIRLKNDSFNYLSFTLINLMVYQIGVFLAMIIGAFILVRKKKYLGLLMCLIAIFTPYILYNDLNGASPKHLLYVIPFSAYLMLTAFKYLIQNYQITFFNKVLLIGIIFLIISQSIIGIATYPKNKPWVGKQYAYLTPYPTFINIGDFHLLTMSIKIGIGAGQIGSSADELYPITGGLFTPLYWHHIKIMEAQQKITLEGLIDQHIDDTVFFTTTQSSRWKIYNNLYCLGYKFKEIEIINNSPFLNCAVFTNINHVVIINEFHSTRSVNGFNDVFLHHYKNMFFHYNTWDWEKYYINEKLTIAMPYSEAFSIVSKE